MSPASTDRWRGDTGGGGSGTPFSIEILATTPITPGTADEPNTSTITVNITPSGGDVSNLIIKLKADWELQSGGHTHESDTNKRPVPRIKTPSGDWVQEYDFTVGNNKIETTFKPSMGASNTKRGIAGKYKIKGNEEWGQ